MSLISELHLDDLSLEDRTVLVDELWESIERERGTAPISDELRAELVRRVEEADRHPEEDILWDEIKAAALARISR